MSVDLVVEEPAWLDHLPDLADVAATATDAALTAVRIDPSSAGIALLACDDARIAGLNTEFRGKPAPTNVLSWPAFVLSPASPGAAPPLPPEGSAAAPIPLGDVAIALQTCAAEAADADLPLKNHCIHLILHGALHLLGYDHQTEPDADVMEGIERDALAGLGIPDPYR